nr:AAA family ATPase [uncultured Chryseobacterium sp.]
MDIILRNNTGNQGKNRLINGFVVRLKIYNNILQELRLSTGDKPEQNYLIIGQRGAGKTTLLYRLKYAIEDDEGLYKSIIPIMFNEEQYNLINLINLWESIAEQLDEIEEFSGIANAVQKEMTGEKNEEEKLYELIEKWLRKINKKIILFIENIDVLLKKFGKEGQQRLREVLTTSNNIRIIGSSTTYFEGIINYSDPFYDFFKIIQLNGLTKQETIKMLLKIAEQSKETEKIELMLSHSGTRVEALRRMTGGNPRMMSYLYQIFLDNANGKAITDLYKLLDDLTFLYKSELDQLSAQHQKIVDTIARNWDAISVKEVVTRTRMESKHVSSVLNALEKNQIVERIPTKTKNNLYRLKDRFLNIWYLMRFGRKKDKENVVWLVRFYDAWCDKSELSERVLHHINNLLGGEYDNIAAIDMVNTFLSCKNVSALDKYRLFQTTKSTLPKDLISNLKLSQKDWFETIKDLVKKKKYDQAINALKEMDTNDLIYNTFSYWIYFNKKEYRKAAENLEWIYAEKKDVLTAFTLGEIFETKLSDISKAIYYYEIALEKGNYDAAFRLGQIYYFEKNNENQAIKNFQLAIENGINEAIMALATIYFTNDRNDDAQRLCLLAIEKGVNEAHINLSILYQIEGKIELAISTLKKAISLGVNEALISLGDLYLTSTKGNDILAKELFQEAVDKGVTDAYSALGKYLLKKETNKKLAVKVLNEGVKNKDANSAHLLAHYYQQEENYEKAEPMFIKSFDLGRKSALLCLSNYAFEDKRQDRKKFILELFEKKMVPYKELLVTIEYCKILVWNNSYEESIDIFLKNQQRMVSVLNGELEDYKEDLISELTTYFIRLIASKQYNSVNQLFSLDEIDFRQILKPLYYAFMKYNKEGSNEYLKAGAEMNETIEEIINEIEKVRKLIS